MIVLNSNNFVSSSVEEKTKNSLKNSMETENDKLRIVRVSFKFSSIASNLKEEDLGSVLIAK